ncbi:NAD(P)/FAD-dependent oxidoreductase [Pectinatus haikarae]|uniref:NAD(P)/FAD-dependent oxidoreductase n=1 Tax=Pectinatus haikarae TaxID=349096 RepID=UPI0018C6CBA7|nr:hypothetical protein [Pectinatus haikarae]
MIRIKNLNTAFNNTEPLEKIAAAYLKISDKYIKKAVIVRKAIDARRYRNSPIFNVFTLDVFLTDNADKKKLMKRLRTNKNIELSAQPLPKVIPIVSGFKRNSENLRPVIAGFGPSGMFCALTLCRYGYRPIILERGRDIDTRHEDVKNFWRTGTLDPLSNVQFGEGGAGTFSDGKLTTRINDAKITQVLRDFVEAGAPQEILYLHKPHIGTDILHSVVKNIRRKILAAGGSIYFLNQLTDLQIINSKLKGVATSSGESIPCENLFLGIGHSARDTYEMLLRKGIQIEAKSFAVGVRIEHPQSLIDASQYGADAGSPYLPVADYALTWQNREKALSCYSFCMCPGGKVVSASSEENRLTTNGMSYYARNTGIANSALLVPVTPADFGGNILSGMEFQRHYENLAFSAGGKNYHAPVQTVGDFLTHQHGSDKFLTIPTYEPGITLADLHELLPAKVSAAIELALPNFDKKIPGFADKSVVMTGLEMRSSAPCRIIRDKNTFKSVSIAGLYPIGEGAGYAGGIMSAAIDGMNAALSYIYKR